MRLELRDYGQLGRPTYFLQLVTIWKHKVINAIDFDGGNGDLSVVVFVVRWLRAPEEVPPVPKTLMQFAHIWQRGGLITRVRNSNLGLCFPPFKCYVLGGQIWQQV